MLARMAEKDMLDRLREEGRSFLSAMLGFVLRFGVACLSRPCCPECGEQMVIANVDVTGGRWDELYSCPTCGTSATVPRQSPWDLFS